LSILTDTDTMPFGKYKGYTMEMVPASYLHWVWVNISRAKQPEVTDYIQSNLAAMKMETPDLIW